MVIASSTAGQDAVPVPGYPVRLVVQEPPSLSRWLWLIKWLIAFPHAVIIGLLWIPYLFTLFFAWVAVVLTGHYPRGLFNFNTGVLRWSTVYSAYVSGLFTDRYPPFALGDTPDYPIRVIFDYPEREGRLGAFFRYFLAIPQLIVSGLLAYVAGALWIVVAVVILFTGRYQRDLFRFIVGINRWILRVNAYLTLTTDRYPPFSLD